ncbi:MAG: hypothetical protein HY313_02910 [Acidobacteria bacterium]|nr:hypothetical protein [Acidobacteriota bacterium]
MPLSLLQANFSLTTACGSGPFFRAALWWRRAWIAAAFFAALLGTACGVPGEPLPPLLEIPQPVNDLSATQIGSQVRLMWSRPLLTTEGTRAQELDRMEIYGVFLPAGTNSQNFPEQAQLLATVRAEDIPNETPVVHELALASSHIGLKAFFAIKATNSRGKDAGFSNVVSLDIANLPEAPGKLQATLTEKAVVLGWEPAERSAFGGPSPQPDGYQVYRAEAQSPQAAEMIGAIEAPRYEDASFAFGHTYVYFIRAFVKQQDSVAITPPSNSAEVIAADRFPPAAPQNIRAVATLGVVEIVWSANMEADLAGYNVYRSEEVGFAKINQEPLPIPLFRDTVLQAGIRYRYHIRAVDKAGNESVPSEETSVTAE